MRIIYIAGPYRGTTPWQVELNIHRARELGAAVASLGGLPVIPQANTAHFDGLAPDQFWLDGTLELMRRCDAVMLTRDWARSSGARAEREEALRLGLPVFEDLGKLTAWLDSDGDQDG